MARTVEDLYDEGVARVEAGQPAAALQSFAAAIAADPDDASGLHGELWAHQGSALASLNRHAEAVAAFENAVEHTPDCADFLVGLADALRALGDRDRAAEYYESALEFAFPGEEIVDQIHAGLEALDESSPN